MPLETRHKPAAALLARAEAAAKRYPHLRRLTADELALIAEAVEAGAYLRIDDAYADYIDGRGGLPLGWGTYVHLEDMGNAAICAAADRQCEKRDAFEARCRSGDLRALAERVQAGRGVQKVAA